MTLLCAALVGLSAAEYETERLQIGGEWCFIKKPAKARRGEAVLAIHGNGQTVTEKTSSFEQGAGFRRLMEALLEQGYIVAQSNHGATAENGMWGNGATQAGVLSLARHLRAKYGIRKWHALAVSAGGATLVNLSLDQKLRLSTALLIVPVISLESMYRCPEGVDRVKGLSEAFGFRPTSACPGDPARDDAFRKATADFDPLRRMQGMPADALRSRMARVRWMAIVNTRDPRVPPAENIAPMVELMKKAGVAMALKEMDLATHSADQPLAKYEAEYVSWLQAAK